VHDHVHHGHPAELAATTAHFFVLVANHRTAKYGRASTAARPRPSFAARRQAPELRRHRAVAAAAACARGRSALSHVPAIRDHQRVRGDPRVPPRHFPDAYVPSSGRTSELRRPLPCKIATRDCMQEFDSKQGPNCTVIDSCE
jgi:hypothetical protein